MKLPTYLLTSGRRLEHGGTKIGAKHHDPSMHFSRLPVDARRCFVSIYMPGQFESVSPNST